MENYRHYKIEKLCCFVFSVSSFSKVEAYHERICKTIEGAYHHVLGISTNKQVLHMPFLGLKKIFNVKTSFPYFPSQMETKKEKRKGRCKKLHKNMHKKGV